MSFLLEGCQFYHASVIQQQKCRINGNSAIQTEGLYPCLYMYTPIYIYIDRVCVIHIDPYTLYVYPCHMWVPHWFSFYVKINKSEGTNTVNTNTNTVNTNTNTNTVNTGWR